ncbi:MULTISPECIES: pyridoxamine 5'-phosphate oxidase [Actinokineospora]|uniref:Pyridoxine/pyridoxamine 5'-phosphate oxidase n=1 Tax=Actinokineospora fastidiosa TaxID=1816 RepID=A0A918L6T4_9PSEU|nr:MULTISPECIES: pyridoxamine 5'-phosphate oxidase [Actinokineospora]UVS76824.1 Pyridoxine/pyridoxamine 5'-phosphate oxidase [Actinokineospora sp. UTMC 2448]GGS15533.1 pyridoxine/pyridoxamine 5'-phosphate oxidase [Actinokineospora fastidiosa]
MADGPDVADITLELPSMRVSYETGALSEAELADTWHEQLQLWLDEAKRAGLAEPNAMVLATAGADGMPSSRTVLAKGLDARGLVFFTNYTSAKSHDLMAARYASATFPWYGLHRQATVRGTVEKVSAAETAAYWAKRPRGSQLGAWASPQSIVVSGRPALEAALANVERRFADAETVPVPPHWGGWRIQPEVVEFWQGRRDRMHDRLRFKLTRDGWKVERLGP